MFFTILSIFLFPIVITLLFFCFSFTHVVSPIRLSLHFTHEVPLPPFIFNCSRNIEDNVDDFRAQLVYVLLIGAQSTGVP